MKIRIAFCMLAVALLSLPTPAEPSERVLSAGLFKNGLAVITREYTVPGPGSYTFASLGSPVHGTLWVESATAVVARSGRLSRWNSRPEPPRRRVLRTCWWASRWR